MVRRSLRMIALCCALAAILAQPIAANAASYTPYDGNIGSSYVTIFRDIVGKVKPVDDYVFFRAGQYEYMLVAGDLEYSAGSFTAETCTVYRIITDSAYSSTYQFFEIEEMDFALNPGSALVYSNLGSYPDLVDRTAFYSFASLVLLLVCVFMYLVRSIFGFTLRRR